MKIVSQLHLFDVCREGTHVLGPGCRYVIWTQGCEHRCPGCLTPESWDENSGFSIDTNDLASDIILAPHIDGITISGGEPFLQAGALTEVILSVKTERPELTVIAYSGYTLEQLKSNSKCSSLLDLIDVLIDGPYIQELNDGVGLRGSNNQHIIAFTNRLDPYLDHMGNGERKTQYILDNKGTLTQIGVPRNKIKLAYE